jgi:beta-lactamase superfamily II metal-dependent hydrolase
MNISIQDGLLQVFYVDHGQCALLTLPTAAGNRFVLIDCGHAADFDGQPWYPGQHLQSLGITNIDLFIITNFDEDHASGFADLRQRGITIGCILGNPSVAPDKVASLKSDSGMGPGIQALTHTMTLRRQAGHAEVVPDIAGLGLTWAWNPYPFFDDENNLSLIVNLRIHGWNFLFTGDMEKAGWLNLLKTNASFRSLVQQVHVLNAAHHGRESGRCAELFQVYGCSPRLVLISDDYKQYESQETTAYYATRASGIPWFRNTGPRKVLTTRKDGEILFSFRNGGFLVW